MENQNILTLHLNDYKKLFQLNNLKNKNNKSLLEKEQLFEESLQLKNKINEMIKEISNLKSGIVKRDMEINKKNKLIEEIIIDTQNKKNQMGLGDINNKLLEKAKNSHLNNLIKKKYKELKKEYKDKCFENEKLKKDIKLTKVCEFNIEIHTLNEELTKIKNIFFKISQENEINKKKIIELNFLKENYSNQQFILNNMQNNIYKNELIASNYEKEIRELNEKLSEKNSKFLKLNEDAKNYIQMKEKYIKEKKEAKNLEITKNKYENQIIDMQKDLKYFKELADKREKKLKEFEKIFLSKKEKNSEYNSYPINNSENIKFIQEDPENKIDSTIILMRSKLTESINNYERILSQNKKLEEKIKELKNCIENFYNKNKELNPIIYNYNYCISHLICNLENFQILSEQKKNNTSDIENYKPMIHQNIEQKIMGKKGEIYKTIDENLIDPNLNNYKIKELSLEEFSYILVKNLEARRIDPNSVLKDLFESISSLDNNKLHITNGINKLDNSINIENNLNTEEYFNNTFLNILNNLDYIDILKLIKQKIIILLSLKNPTEQQKVDEFLSFLYEINNKDIPNVMHRLVRMISSVRVNKEKKENKLKLKIFKVNL